MLLRFQRQYFDCLIANCVVLKEAEKWKQIPKFGGQNVSSFVIKKAISSLRLNLFQQSKVC